MARTDLGQGRLGLARRRRHLGVPLVAAVPLGVLDLDGDRRADRAAVADTADERQLVDLEALSWSPAEAQPAAGELSLDLLNRHRQAGWQPLDDDHEPLPVRLTRSEEAQHAATLLVALCLRDERCASQRHSSLIAAP